MNGLKLSPPWIAYQRKLEALFAGDSDVEIGQLYEYDDGRKELWIHVHDEKKYRALSNLLPTYPDFGNAKVKVVLKFKDQQPQDIYQDIKDLFEGNPNVQDIQTVTDFAGMSHTFVRFIPEVVQFYNDDISDLNGNWSGLNQDIAREVFDLGYNGVHFTTAPKDENLAKPLGEWP